MRNFTHDPPSALPTPGRPRALSCFNIFVQSSEMNVAFPKPGTEDEQMEMPIPEQFVHALKMDPSPRITSDVSDLYSH